MIHTHFRARDNVVAGTAYTLTLASVGQWSVTEDVAGEEEVARTIFLGPRPLNSSNLAQAQQHAWDALKALPTNALGAEPDMTCKDIFCAFIMDCYGRARKQTTMTEGDDVERDRKRQKTAKALDTMPASVIDAILGKIRQEIGTARKVFLNGSTIPKPSVLAQMLDATTKLEFTRSDTVIVDTCTPYRLETGVVLVDVVKQTVSLDKQDGLTLGAEAKIRASKRVVTIAAFRERFVRLILGQYFVALSLNDAGVIVMKKTPAGAGFAENREWVTFDKALAVITKLDDLIKLGLTVDGAYIVAKEAMNEARLYMNGDDHDMGPNDRPTLDDAFAHMIRSAGYMQYEHRRLSSAGDHGHMKGGGKAGISKAEMQSFVAQAVSNAFSARPTPVKTPRPSPGATSSPKGKGKVKRDAKKGAKKVDFKAADEEDEGLERRKGGNPASNTDCSHPDKCYKRKQACRFRCWKQLGAGKDETEEDEEDSD